MWLLRQSQSEDEREKVQFMMTLRDEWENECAEVKGDKTEHESLNRCQRDMAIIYMAQEKESSSLSCFNIIQLLPFLYSNLSCRHRRLLLKPSDVLE